MHYQSVEGCEASSFDSELSLFVGARQDVSNGAETGHGNRDMTVLKELHEAGKNTCSNDDPDTFLATV